MYVGTCVYIYMYMYMYNKYGSEIELSRLGF